MRARSHNRFWSAKNAFRVCGVLAAGALTALGAENQSSSVRPVSVRIETTPAPEGTSLLTIYRNDVPQITLLREAPGGTAPNGPFRQVWDYSYARPGWLRQFAAAVPFFYHRVGASQQPERATPAPIFDFSQPRKGTWGRIAETLIQSNVLDGRGMLWRAPTRAYRGNAQDYRQMHLARTLEVLEDADSLQLLSAEATPEDWSEAEGRLALAPRLFGGFVSGEHASRIALRERTDGLEDREGNWDLLRQRVERNGLYVRALSSADGLPRQAVVWFAADRPSLRPAHFDGKFLQFSDPWRDSAIDSEIAYSESWFLNADGAVVQPTDAGAKASRMIPLAVYALDYPRTPLLLIDFRANRAQRREVIRRAATDASMGVFGLTPYANMAWFAARTTYLWYQDRRGGALNRQARMAAYARFRQFLLDGPGLDPSFCKLVEVKLDQIALDPFEQSSRDEAELASREHESLMRWAANPNGLARVLARDRARDRYAASHTILQRASARTLSVVTAGLYQPYRSGAAGPAKADPEVSAESRKRKPADVENKSGDDGFASGGPVVLSTGAGH